MIIINWIYLVLSTIGIIYLIYSILCRNRVTLYNRSDKIVIIKSIEFLKLQLYFSIVNSLFLIIYGIVLTIYNVNHIYFLLAPLIFHFINYLLRIVSKKKKYINY